MSESNGRREDRPAGNREGPVKRKRSTTVLVDEASPSVRRRHVDRVERDASFDSTSNVRYVAVSRTGASLVTHTAYIPLLTSQVHTMPMVVSHTIPTFPPLCPPSPIMCVYIPPSLLCFPCSELLAALGLFVHFFLARSSVLSLFSPPFYLQ